MSSMTGLKRTDGQRLTPLLGALCGPSTWTLEFGSRHPTSPLLRKVLDLNFTLVTAVARHDATDRDVLIDGGAGPLRARLFEPADLPADPGLLVYFHGGGFSLGSVDSHANSCRFIAKRGRCKVLSVEYRMGPEHRVPAAFEDARAAFRWALASADALGVSADRIAVGGDSAGGQLALAVGLIADGGPRPAFVWALYPVVDADAAAYDSAWTFARGPLLSQRNLLGMMHHYAPTKAEVRDPHLDLIHRPDLGELPPTYLCTAGMDPLRDQGEHFVARAQEAGASVVHKRFLNMPHGFSLLFVEPSARAACEEICAVLATALSPVPVAA